MIFILYVIVVRLIGVHEMHGRMHPINILQQFCWPMTPFHDAFIIALPYDHLLHPAVATVLVPIPKFEFQHNTFVWEAATHAL